MYNQHIILDFEMNPVSKANKTIRKELRNEIIEIGAVKLDENYEIIDKFSCLIKPQYNKNITAYITKLTGITSCDVKNAVSFEAGLALFEKWIGNERTRIYTWSDNDLNQLKRECSFKNVSLPNNMKRWLDFQVVYPKLLEVGSFDKRMSLNEAAQWYGLTVDSKNAHRALYDAEITAELVMPVLTGEYKKQTEIFRKVIVKENREKSSACLGDLFDSVFEQIMQSIQQEPEFVR